LIIRIRGHWVAPINEVPSKAIND